MSLPSKFELSFAYKVTGNTKGMRFGLFPFAQKSGNHPTYCLEIQKTTTKYVGVYRDSSTHAVGSDTSITGTDYHTFRIVRDGNTFKWYIGDTQLNSDITLTWFDNYSPYCLGYQYWANGTIGVKELKVKPL